MPRCNLHTNWWHHNWVDSCKMPQVRPVELPIIYSPVRSEGDIKHQQSYIGQLMFDMEVLSSYRSQSGQWSSGCKFDSCYCPWASMLLSRSSIWQWRKLGKAHVKFCNVLVLCWVQRTGSVLRTARFVHCWLRVKSKAKIISPKFPTKYWSIPFWPYTANVKKQFTQARQTSEEYHCQQTHRTSYRQPRSFSPQ